MNKTQISVFWFRRDLRWEDNKSLYHALQSGLPVLCIFIFDENILDDIQDKKDKRVSMLYDSLKKINNKWQYFQSSLLLHKGKPLEVWKNITTEFEVKKVYFSHDFEPYAIQRDTTIREFLQSINIAVYSYKDQSIFEKNEIIKKDESPFLVYTHYKKTFRLKLTENDILHYHSEDYLQNLLSYQANKFLPIEAFGFQYANYEIDIHISHDILKDYDINRNLPAIQGTTKLSPLLRFGLISIRYLFRKYFEHTKFIDELIWREFYFMLLYFFPESVNLCFKKRFEALVWNNNVEYFKLWCGGKTGIPIVDAGMRELNHTGLMHGRVRMIVASFLTKHLLIDWRWGERYFASKLLDFELSSNVGNWQWVAGTGCDATPYFRIFNPLTQAERFDAQELYVRKWVKELNTKDYPKPIINLNIGRERCLRAFKNVR